MRQNSGMTAMPASEGIKAFYKSLAGDRDQVMVINGYEDKLREKLDGAKVKPINRESGLQAINIIELREKVINALKRIMSNLLKLKMEAIDEEKLFSEYGFDSILLTAYVNRINEEMTLELQPTIFYEYPALRSLTMYIADAYPSALAARFSVGAEKGKAQNSQKIQDEKILGQRMESSGLIRFKRPGRN